MRTLENFSIQTNPDYTLHSIVPLHIHQFIESPCRRCSHSLPIPAAECQDQDRCPLKIPRQQISFARPQKRSYDTKTKCSFTGCKRNAGGNEYCKLCDQLMEHRYDRFVERYRREPPDGYVTLPRLKGRSKSLEMMFFEAFGWWPQEEDRWNF